MHARSSWTAAVFIVSSMPSLASASVHPDTNPFHSLDVASLVSHASDVRAIGHGKLELRRTGDTIAVSDVASNALSARIDDGRYLLVVPFTNAAGAQHSAIVFAAGDKEAYEVGGFAARGDHFFVSLERSIVVSFFARPSGGRTLAAGGPAPTSTSELTLVGRRLAEIATSAPTGAVANTERP